MIGLPLALVPFRGYLIGGALVLVAASLIGNVVQYRLVENANEARTVAEQDAKVKGDAATACSESVSSLQKAARDAAKLTKPKIDAAIAKERDRAARAQAILSTPATVPGDACQSAADRAAAWLNGK